MNRFASSISSLLPFLSSHHQPRDYSSIPLTTTSRPHSPRLGLPDDEKPTSPYSTAQQRRSILVNLWLYSSPILVLILGLTALRKSTPLETGVLNPYACTPRPKFASLAEVCAADSDSGGKEPLDEGTTVAASYNLELDRRLSQAQCDAVFPGLYLEIDRAVDYWKARGGVTQKDLDDAEERGQARAMIYNNRLYVKSFADYQQGTRTKATLALINEALITSPEPVPDIEFVIQTGDNGLPQGAPWALGRKEKEEQLTLMPDYGFFSWPEPGVNSMLEVSDNCRMYESKLKWGDKVNKLFWRGAFMVDIRKELWEIAHRFKWGAIYDLDWQDREMVDQKLLTPEEHCQYKFLAHVEGFAYSGRLKYLTQCMSVIVAHKMQFVQHFHHLFNTDPNSPSQNLVLSPGRNFEELPSVMADLLSDDVKAQRIANNSYEFWSKWLSPSSVDCYWRRLFSRWVEVQRFEPVLLRNMTSYNSFILMGRVSWAPF
ncbi:hypothetical protein JCM11641_002902 [Rhodosporidiobolus odoratus]